MTSLRSTPVSFLLRSVRKKTLISARFTGEPNSSAMPSASALQAARRRAPAASSINSSAASGAGYCPVCCWIIGRGRRAEEAQLRLADLDRPAPALAVVADTGLDCLLRANQRESAASSSFAAGTTSVARPIAAAALASIDSPPVTISTALDRPTIRGVPRRAAPARKQAELHFRKAELAFGSSVITRRSHQMASSAPPPTQMPSIAATVTNGIFDKPLKQLAARDGTSRRSAPSAHRATQRTREYRPRR